MYVEPKSFIPKEDFEDIISEWGEEIATRGYDIFNYDGTGLLEIERIDDIFAFYEQDVTDEDCAREADRSGFCKIIPVDELPKDFEYRYFGWIDTLENREMIRKYTENGNCAIWKFIKKEA